MCLVISADTVETGSIKPAVSAGIRLSAGNLTGAALQEYLSVQILLRQLNLARKTKARMKNIKTPNCSNVFQDLETIGSLSAASISASFYRGAIIADIKTGK